MLPLVELSWVIDIIVHLGSEDNHRLIIIEGGIWFFLKLIIQFTQKPQTTSINLFSKGTNKFLRQFFLAKELFYVVYGFWVIENFTFFF